MKDYISGIKNKIAGVTQNPGAVFGIFSHQPIPGLTCLCDVWKWSVWVAEHPGLGIGCGVLLFDFLAIAKGVRTQDRESLAEVS